MSMTVDSSCCSFCGGGTDPLAPRRFARGATRICADCVQVGLSALIAGRGRIGEQAFPGPRRACSFCAIEAVEGRRHDAREASVCGDCLTACARQVVGRERVERRAAPVEPPAIVDLLADHFAPHDVNALLTQSRRFPERMRADVQAALDVALGVPETARMVGIHRRYGHDTLEFPDLLGRGHDAVRVGPLQFVEVDVGEAQARRCLKAALWLREEEGVRVAALLSTTMRYGEGGGLHIEVAVPPGEAGARVAQRLLEQVEAAVKAGRAYRGKALSLELDRDYGGRATGVKVHALRAVKREEVILPERTLALLEKNVFDFHRQRPGLRRLGLQVKKGLLFHGPPGTGKTHTITYLASCLEGHTTLIITAEQIGLLGEYMTLARLLQPSIVVIEDADLIGRERNRQGGACEEARLNRLLNEMDGLREDAEVIFILTTNDPASLEPALASRPGRIDQPIEFPLPDLDGRRKLVRLYARGLPLADAQVESVARETEGASAAFIKELMRRVAQAALERDAGATVVDAADVRAALEEMLFSRGRLDSRLLGFHTVDD
jgi:hypothetical protein